MEEESTSILLNNTFSALNSREARQLQVKPIGSKWVYKTKHNPDGSTRYKARLVIKGYEQTDFGETYAPVGKLTTFRYLISLIGKYGWNMDHLDVVTAFLNPEIHEVAALSRYNSRPFTSHMTAAKRVLQYLKSTADFRLHFTGNGIGIGIGISIGIGIGIDIDIGNSLAGCSDSDWANDSADRKSQGGHVFLASNGAVSWQSRKQGLIAMSTLEAEFIACSEDSREAKWLHQLQKDIHGSQRDSPPLPINCDNQGALTLITTGIIKARSKHIDVCYHNSRDLHKRRIVNYSYVHTDDNVADILTKALTKDKHTKFTKAMGLW